MKITIIGSGSKGNSTLIETKSSKVLIDAGLPLSNIEQRLNRQLPKLDIIIITHTHNDHIKGLNSILKKQTPLVYTIENDLQAKTKTKDLKYDRNINLKDLKITLFELSHDIPCLGVHIKFEEKELVYITDTGYIKNTILNKYKNKTVYILESNYDEQMLKDGAYPFHLKQRIRSDKGHLSNTDACRYIKALIGPKTKYLCLAHLSEENNQKELVNKNVIEAVQGKEIDTNNIIICSQNEKKELQI